MTFEELYDRHFEFVWRSLHRLGVERGDLDDAAQEVFLVVHRKLDDFAERSKVTTWLYTICLRTARDRRRRAHVRREISDSDGVERIRDDAADVTVALERRDDALLFEAVLRRMELEQRAVFTLFELEGMTGQDIAEVLTLPLGTVYSRLRLAREAFRRSVVLLAARRDRAASRAEPLS